MIILLIFLSSSFLIPNSNNITEIDRDFNDFSQPPLLADKAPVLFEGNENALNITEYGNSYKYNQEVSLTNQEELNLNYYLDDIHNWKVSKIETQIQNIQDTREWVKNNDYTDVNTYRVNVTLSNIPDTSPPQHNYTEDLDPDPNNPSNIHSEIIQNNASLIRVHFSRFEIETDWDIVCFYDENNILQYVDTGKKSAFFSPWIKTTHIKITMDSDLLYQWWGYDIDYYEYVNDSLDYYESFDHWGYDNGTMVNNFGSNSIDNETAMYVNLVGEPYRTGSGYFGATYYENDFSEIYQNITIPRGQIIDGYISFDYYAEYAMDSNENYIYCEINNKRVYSKGLGDIVDAGRQIWHSTGKINMDLPAFNEFLIPLIANLNAPFTPLNLSFISAKPSKETPMYLTPAFLAAKAFSLEISVPFVEMTGLKFNPFAYSINSNKSFLMKGSPPEKRTTGHP